MAAGLGKRLLAEVQEVGLDEILQEVRLQHDPEPSHFGIPPLDEIVNSALATKRRTSTSIPSSNPPPILELIPQAPGSGTTHFLYLLTAKAILPPSLGGKDACVTIIDTDNTFSVSRLVQQLRAAIKNSRQDHQEQEKEQDPTTNTDAGTEPGTEADNSIIASALRHVHIFRPQSQTSLIATLDSLPTSFLPTTNPGHNNSSNNLSFHRPLAFIALDSLPSFHWQQRAESETRAFEEEHQHQQNQQEPTPANATKIPPPPKPEPKPKPTIFHSLQTLSLTFPTTPQILTNPSHFPRVFSLSSHQHPLKTIPLTLFRNPTRPFSPMISLSEALREKGQREMAVRRAGWRVVSNVYAAASGGESGGGGGGAGGQRGTTLPMEFEIGIDGERGIWIV